MTGGNCCRVPKRVSGSRNHPSRHGWGCYTSRIPKHCFSASCKVQIQFEFLIAETRSESDNGTLTNSRNMISELANSQLLQGWFEAQAQRTPNARAVVAHDGQFSYAELNRR